MSGVARGGAKRGLTGPKGTTQGPAGLSGAKRIPACFYVWFPSYLVSVEKYLRAFWWLRLEKNPSAMRETWAGKIP